MIFQLFDKAGTTHSKPKIVKPLFKFSGFLIFNPPLRTSIRIPGSERYKNCVQCPQKPQNELDQFVAR